MCKMNLTIIMNTSTVNAFSPFSFAAKAVIGGAGRSVPTVHSTVRAGR